MLVQVGARWALAFVKPVWSKGSVRITVLGSGSEGNATLIEAGGSRVMVDAGLAFRRTRERIESVRGHAPESLDALVITHEHHDHAGCADVCARRFGARVYATGETMARIRLKDSVGRTVFKAGGAVRIGELNIESFSLPHDAPQVALRFEHGGEVVGLVTDLGHVPEGLAAFLRPCRTLLFESNHDLDMLRGGDYPERLKRRIAGPLGHLSNQQSAGLLAKLGKSLERLVLMHLSKNNNRPRLARESAQIALAKRPSVEIMVARHDEALVIDSARSQQLSLSL